MTYSICYRFGSKIVELSGERGRRRSGGTQEYRRTWDIWDSWASWDCASGGPLPCFTTTYCPAWPPLLPHRPREILLRLMTKRDCGALTSWDFVLEDSWHSLRELSEGRWDRWGLWDLWDHWVLSPYSLHTCDSLCDKWCDCCTYSIWIMMEHDRREQTEQQ